MLTWRKECCHRRIFFAIDNDDDRAAAINSASSVLAAQAIVRAIVKLSAKYTCYRWFMRVPSPSNLADDPSRGEDEDLRRRQAVRHPLDWGEVVSRLFV